MRMKKLTQIFRRKCILYNFGFCPDYNQLTNSGKISTFYNYLLLHKYNASLLISHLIIISNQSQMFYIPSGFVNDMYINTKTGNFNYH